MAARAPAFSTRTRGLIQARSGGRCERCSGRGGEYSHRRPRGVRDAHTACPCNAQWLCRTCHRWVHLNPRDAIEIGMVVSRYRDHPGSVPVRTTAGLVVLDCEGGYRVVSTET